MQRRGFLRLAGATSMAAFGLARGASAQMHRGPGAGGMGSSRHRFGDTPSALTSGLPLRRLDKLASPGSELRATIVASPYLASLVPGGPTELWGFNYDSPGPVLELREGQRATIAFQNRLGLDSTIHWHGLAVPADQDGSPLDPVPPGTDRLYTFDVPMGSAGTYWYHPHAHRTTTLQVGHGLAAPLVVLDATDPLSMLPMTDRTLMITSLALDQDGAVAAPTSSMSGMGLMAGSAAELLINGQKLPVLTADPGATERWRIINATANRYLRLAIDGHRFAVVATDGGLLAEPLADITEWLLAPAQRIEVVVTIDLRQAARFTLRDLGYGGGMMSANGSELMTIATTAAAPRSPIELPAKLRAIEDLGAAAAEQNVVLSGGGMRMMMGSFLINGETFDMNRVDLTTTAGRVEQWNFINATPLDHPMHVHGTQFQVVGRTVRGVSIPLGFSGWFDTVNVPAGQTVAIKIRQTLPGKRMLHCHLLPHEDAGMMAVLDVRST
jgi:suppressor of ftsI